VSPSQLRVLLVEDSDDDAQLILRELKRGGREHVFMRVQSRDALVDALRDQTWDLVIGDYSMPGFSGAEALAVVREHDPDVPFIFVSGTIGEEMAVAAMRAGARDYVLKGNLKRLLPAVERELREAAARRENRALEAQLMQAQKMEAVGRLAGGVAHDFNNLLTVVLGEADLALSVAPPEGEVTESLREIRGAAERAAVVTRQLLAFSRRELVKPEVVDLNQAIPRVEKMVRRLIGEDVELTVRLDPTLGATKCDPGQIEQVLINLVVNARDAMPGGGSVSVETSNVVVGAEDAGRMEVTAGDFVALTVSDTGSGIAPEHLPEIFDPFFTTKGPGAGTGLGLPTCHSIVKQAGGHIAVDSGVGVGTTFTVLLPRVDEAVTRAETETRDIPRGTETILLVEDDARVRTVARRMLTSLGYTVLEAAGGDAALELLRAHRDQIALLLTDIVLPGIGGREIAERARALEPNLRVLFASGYTEDVILRYKVLVHDIAMVQKPFTPDSLGRKVREVLDAV
jgi:two-component system cell cycle sensor histidine kinase/response regulator CckA